MKILITGGSGFIGTNLVEKLAFERTHVLLNIDNAAPKDSRHNAYWKPCDILNATLVNEIFESFRPDAVIHLASVTDTDPKKTIEDYRVNIEGSENILTAIKHCTNVQRAIITSTQFVHQYQGLPKHDQDFAPHTVYGESKVIMEKMTRDANLACTWTIIRPTNIWGPWHLRYPHEFWKVLSKGLYVHPGREPVIRSYGYVGNVVFQIISILESPVENVQSKVFYVGDLPIDIYNWVNGFSMKQTGRKVKIVSRSVVRTIARIGDILSIINIRFPINSSRYKSMTNSNIAPFEQTFEILGPPPYSLEQGIDETIDWMKKYHPDLVKI